MKSENFTKRDRETLLLLFDDDDDLKRRRRKREKIFLFLFLSLIEIFEGGHPPREEKCKSKHAKETPE